MIRVPTGELVGLLSDVIGFAAAAKVRTHLSVVRLYWNGTVLHAEATDQTHWGHAWWHPHDDPPVDAQEEMHSRWGGADAPWSILIPVDDAKDLVKNFTLTGKKTWAVALEVSTGEFNRLRVFRPRSDEHSALRQDIEGYLPPTDYTQFPDVPSQLEARRDPADRQVAAIAFDPRRLAVLGKVRPRGPARFTFWGTLGAADLTIGDRFEGALQAARIGAGEEPAVDDFDDDVDEVEARVDELEAARQEVLV